MKNIKIITVLFTIILFLAACINPTSPTSGTLNEVFKYPQNLWGEWIRMDTGDVWYIASNYISVSDPENIVALERQSNNVTEVSLKGGRKYYLYASRIANTSFSGKIAAFETGTGQSARAVGSSLGGISVVVSNLNDKANELTSTTEADGSFTVDDAIPGDSYEISVEGQTTTVTPIADGDDIGTITLTDGINFKTSIKPTSSSVDMQRLYANLNIYDFTITIQNTGDADCLAATYTLDFDDDLIVASQPSSPVLGTIEPGKSRIIELSLGCKLVQSEYAFKKIGVRVTDEINKKTWEDSVSLKFNKTPVNFNIKANSKVSGVVITPNANAYSFSGTSSSLTMPWSTRDYLVVFSGATADTEVIYSLGINVMADDNFDSFADPGNYEGNNTEDAAMAIRMSDKIMSYLHKNDIDYYKINLGVTAPEIKPVSVTDFAYTDSNGNEDKSIQPSESGYLDIRVRNNTNSRQSTSVTLTSTSAYVTIEQGTATIEDLSAEYYTTLTGSASSSASYSSLLYQYGLTKAFRFAISDDCPAGTDIPFTVTFTDSWGNTWTDTLTVPVVATGASIAINAPVADNYKISEAANGNGDDWANPHETHYLDIRIKNGGTSKALGLQATLTSASAYVTIEQGTATIGDLSAEYYTTLTGSASSSASYSSLLYQYGLTKAFRFAISDNCPAGTDIPFTVTFTDSWGNTWTDTLTVPVVGTTVTGITYDDAWDLQSDGRRKSPAISHNSVTKTRVSFTAGANAFIVIQLDVSSESGYDYAFISTLDNGSATYSSGYYTGSRISGEQSVMVTIPVPTAGSHFVDICYRKDNAQSNGSDCAWVIVSEKGEVRS
jgi:hypothetical protein